MILNALRRFLHPLTAFWSKSWNLCFNEQKCILVKFSASTPKVCEDYSLNDHILNTSSSHKDFGIISSDLDWSDHFQYISSQAYKTFGLLRRTFCNCNSIHAKYCFIFP